MDIKKIIAIYFSPNASTKEIVLSLGKSIGNYEIEEVNLNTVESRNKKREFKKDELVIIGLPVYADRLPSISNEIFENIRGEGTPIVAVVSYGNRDYGDALLELKDKLESLGMKIISAAAIIGEHCLNTNVATNRPDAEDHKRILEYGNSILEKLRNISDIEKLQNISVKGEYPYHPLKSQRTPQGDERCIQCGQCAKDCPVDAIDTEDFRKTDSNICIFCGRCIQVCPTNARDMKDKDFLAFMKKLEEMTEERREIEVFID